MASSVNLGEVLEDFITAAVKSGRYGSRSEVLREGVRLVQEREALWVRFETEITKGIESIKQDGGIPLDDAIAEVQRRIEGRTHGKRAA
jgi:antitoxin ParD1/3/4